MTRNEALGMLGISELRKHQMEPVRAVCEGRDVIVRMPTSGGKSLIFQLPALMWAPRLTLVFSPLKALQADQVMALQEKGVKARMLNSSLSTAEREHVLREVQQKEATLLYLAPEQLGNKEVKEALKNADIAMVAVDEAHILARDQDGFRKAYKKIGRLIAKLDNRPVMSAFTATATARDQRVIAKSLKMEKPAVFTVPMRRENLRLQIKTVDSHSKTNKKGDILRGKRRIVKSCLKRWDGNGSAIIYVPTVKEVKRLQRWLKVHGWTAGKYHGKMSDKKRAAVQAKFMSGKIKVMVATNAFGLGIDKPNVRLVIHAGLPLSMDGYVQEVGRAGRDGKESVCVLVYSPSDFAANKATLCHGVPKKQRPAALARLNALQELAGSSKCLWQGIERYFGEKPKEKCKNCCNCRAKMYKMKR